MISARSPLDPARGRAPYVGRFGGLLYGNLRVAQMARSTIQSAKSGKNINGC